MTGRKSAQIVATAFSYGSKHDFQLFQDDGSDFAEHLRILRVKENAYQPSRNDILAPIIHLAERRVYSPNMLESNRRRNSNVHYH